MPGRRTFLSPKINPLVVGFIRLVFPALLRGIFGGITVLIPNEDLEKLRRYKGQRMLLLPNHPTGEEPAVLFQISKWLDEVFNFVAAREVFDWEHGFRGWVLRRVGTYSVIRGAADRESFMMSKKILMEGKNRLVIFIEGEISRENDTLIPFEPGVIQLAFWAQEALLKEEKKERKKGKNPAANPPESPPIYMAPVAIKYFYEPGVETAIEQSLANLEKTVGITPPESADRYDRVRAIGETILTVQEALHQMVSLPGTSMNERVAAIKNRMLKKMEIFLDLRPDPDATALTRMREIRNTMDRLIHTYDDGEELTEYEKRMVEHFRLALSEFYQDLDRVAYFLTYDEAYLRDNPTPERFIEMLRRLEREVYGASKLTHPRLAIVKVGDVISTRDYVAEYEEDKKTCVKKVAERLEDDMMTLLAGIQRP